MSLSPKDVNIEERVVRRCQPLEKRVLAIGQERLWYLNQLAPNSPVYNLAYWCRLSGPLNIAALRAALNAVVRRHQVLRTVILAPGGKPIPVLLKKWSVELKENELNRPVADSSDVAAIVQHESARPFNFARDVLLRAALIRISDREWVFLHNAPHLAFEGGSVEILYNELAFYYNAFVIGTAKELPEPLVQYSDFACWQRNFLSGSRLASLIQYWRNALNSPPALDLPLDYSRPAVHTQRGRHHFFVITPDLLQRAAQFFSRAGTTRYRGLCAAFFVLLHAYSGQSDILLGSPFAPRCSGVDELIGFFVNTVVLRADLSGKPSFIEVIRQVDANVRGAIEHSDLTFDKLVEAARVPRDTSRTPLFQANFRAPKRPYPSLQLEGVTATRACYAENGTSKFDLSLEIDPVGENCFFEYCSDLFREDTVKQMVADFKTLLEELISRPEVPVSDTRTFTEIRGRKSHPPQLQEKRGQ